MKRQAVAGRVACILVVLVALVVSAQTTASAGSQAQRSATPQAPRGNAEQEIRAAQQQLLESARNDDQEEARRILAEDLTWVGPGGNLTTRDGMLSGTPNPPREVNIERVRTYGDSAIVTGSAQFEGGRNVQFLQEWVNRDGQWKLLAHQATNVATPATGQAGAAPAPMGTSGISAAGSSAPTLNSDEERAVWKAQGDLQKAFLAGDASAYSALTSDDYVRIAANGDRQGKTEFLQSVKRNAGQSPGRLESGDVQIAVHGDTARLVMTTWGTLPGGQQAPPSRVTRVFVKHGDRWQQAAAIFTPITQ